VLLLGCGFRLRKFSTGTAICGGSAIAAVAPITNANEDEIAVSLGTVFVLNSVALLAFPAIGSALHLTQTQFGLWAALALMTPVPWSVHRRSLGRGTGCRNHSQVGTCVVDCSHVRRNGTGQQEQGAHPLAMLHSVLLFGRRGQYIHSNGQRRLS